MCRRWRVAGGASARCQRCIRRDIACGWVGGARRTDGRRLHRDKLVRGGNRLCGCQANGGWGDRVDLAGNRTRRSMHHTQQHLLSPIIFSRARNDHDDDGDGVDNGREEQLESTLVTSYFPGHVVGDCMRTRHELFVFLGRSVGRCSNLGLPWAACRPCDAHVQPVFRYSLG